MQTINIKTLANHIKASKECKEGYKEPHLDAIEEMCDNLPSGSGIDAGMKILLEECKKDKIVFNCDFHHMDQNGYYDGWTSHNVIITPSLIDGFNVKITGRDRNQIKDHLYDIMYELFIYQ